MFLLLKNLPKKNLFPVFLIRFHLDAIAALFFLFQGHWQDTIAVIRAQLSFLRQFRKMKQKRRIVNEKIYRQTYQKSIVFEHYIKKKNQFNGIYLK
jgi:hypothetical protein